MLALNKELEKERVWFARIIEDIEALRRFVQEKTTNIRQLQSERPPRWNVAVAKEERQLTLPGHARCSVRWHMLDDWNALGQRMRSIFQGMGGFIASLGLAMLEKPQPSTAARLKSRLYKTAREWSDTTQKHASL